MQMALVIHVHIHLLSLIKIILTNTSDHSWNLFYFWMAMYQHKKEHSRLWQFTWSNVYDQTIKGEICGKSAFTACHHIGMFVFASSKIWLDYIVALYASYHMDRCI